LKRCKAVKRDEFRRAFGSSVRRILEAKARLGLEKEALPDLAALNEKFGSVNWQREAQDISDRGITLLRDTPHRCHWMERSRSRAAARFFTQIQNLIRARTGARVAQAVRFVTTLRADTRFVSAANLKTSSPDSMMLRCGVVWCAVSDRKGKRKMCRPEQAALAEQVIKPGSR